MKIKYKTILIIWSVFAVVVLAKDIIVSQIFEKNKRTSSYNLEQGEYPLIVKVGPKYIIKVYVNGDSTSAHETSMTTKNSALFG